MAEMDGGDRLTQVFAALLLCGVAFVVTRAFVAGRRGEDPSQAAKGAFETLKPGLFIGGVGLFAFLIFAAFSSVIVILAILQFVTGDDNYGTAALAVFIGGIVVLVGGVVWALRWGFKRVRRTAAARPSSNRDLQG